MSSWSSKPRSFSKINSKEGFPASLPLAYTSQSALQAEEDKAHGDLQEEHRQNRDENQHAGVDPVEGIWKQNQVAQHCILNTQHSARGSMSQVGERNGYHQDSKTTQNWHLSLGIKEKWVCFQKGPVV